jgi:hypothetical protein
MGRRVAVAFMFSLQTREIVANSGEVGRLLQLRIDLMQGDIIGCDQRAGLHSDPACPLDNALGARLTSGGGLGW